MGKGRVRDRLGTKPDGTGWDGELDNKINIWRFGSMRSESEVFFSRLVIIETSVLVEELLSLGLLVR